MINKTSSLLSCLFVHLPRLLAEVQGASKETANGLNGVLRSQCSCCANTIHQRTRDMDKHRIRVELAGGTHSPCGSPPSAPPARTPERTNFPATKQPVRALKFDEFQQHMKDAWRGVACHP